MGNKADFVHKHNTAGLCPVRRARRQIAGEPPSALPSENVCFPVIFAVGIGRWPPRRFPPLDVSEAID